MGRPRSKSQVDQFSREVKMQVKSFNVGLGAQIQIQLSGMTTGVKCLLVGMETDQYLLVRFPIASGVLNRLHEGNRATVRCIYAGTVYGFYCNVMNHVVKPAPLVFLSYPASIEVLNLRKSERVDCFVPVTATVREAAYEGIILDISIEGCRFVIENAPERGVPLIQMNETLTMAFQLSSTANAIGAVGKAKNLAQDNHGLTLGVSFEEPEGALLKAIEGFVGRVLSYR
jgi:c-di-GMP-binding flagellar brake protein YcgR